MALAVSQSEQETQGKRASPLEPPNRVVPRVNLAYMQDKRRRNDFASTEVGEVKGGRVTQQAFEVAYKKDSGISMQRCQEREATGGRTPRKMARLKDPAPASFSVPLIFEKGRGEKPGRQSTTQAQGLKIFSYAEATPLTARGTRERKWASVPYSAMGRRRLKRCRSPTG